MGKKKDEMIVPTEREMMREFFRKHAPHTTGSDFLYTDPKNNLKDEKTGDEVELHVPKHPIHIPDGYPEPITTMKTPSVYDRDYSPGLPGGYGELRAKNQPWYAEMANAVVEPIVNAPFMLGQYVSAGFMPDDFKDLEDSAAYVAYDFFKNHADQIRENIPIYKTETEGGFQQAREYLMSTLQQVGESAMPFLAIGAGVSAATGATSGLLGGVSAKIMGRLLQGMLRSKVGADRISLLRGAIQASNVGKGVMGIGETFGTAYALNRTESMIEAADNYGGIYESHYSKLKNDLLRSTGQTELTPEQELDIQNKAKDTASIGAQATNEFNRINILLNLTSAARFLKPIKRSRDAFKQMTNKSIMKAVMGETLQESAEEINNLLAQKYGEGVAEGELKKDMSPIDFSERMKYLFSKDALGNILSSEGAHSAFAGALGGGIQTGLTEGLKRKTKKYNEALDAWTKTVEDINAVKEMKGDTPLHTLMADSITKSKLLKDYNTALEKAIKKKEDEGVWDDSEVNLYQNRILQLQALSAFEKGAGAELEGLYESLRDMSPEEAEALGYDTEPDSPYYYKNLAQDSIETVLELEAQYNYSKTFENKNDVYYNRALNGFINKEIENTQIVLDGAKSLVNERASEIFGDVAYDPANYTPVVQPPLAPDPKSPTYQQELPAYLKELAEFEKQMNQFKTMRDQLMNSTEFKVFQRNEQYMKNMKSWLKKNNIEYDNLIDPSQQKKEKLRKIKEKSEREKELKAVQEREQRLKTEKVKEEEKRKKNNQSLLNLGYAQDEIDRMNDDIKNDIIKNKKKKEQASPQTPPQSPEQPVQEGIPVVDDEELEQEGEEEEQTPLDEQEMDDQEGEEDQPLPDGEEPETEPQIKPRKGELARIAEKEFKGKPLTERQQMLKDMYPDEYAEVYRAVKSENTPVKETEAPVPFEEEISPEVTQAEQKALFEVMTAGEVDEKKTVLGKLINGAADAIAYLSRPFKRTETGDSNHLIVSKEEITNLLNDNLHISLLHPEKYQPGTKLTLKPNPAYDGEVNDPVNKGKKVKWSELNEKLDPNSEQYISSVPIAIYNSANELIGYVHDLTWLQNQENNVQFDDQSDTSNLMNLRYTVLSQGSFETVVNFKSKGTLFVAADKSKAPVSDRLKGSNLHIFTNNGFPKGTPDVINSKYLELGRIYAISEMANGQFIALPVDTNYIERSTIPFAPMTSNLLLQWFMTDPNMENDTFKDLKDMSGFDFNTFNGFREFTSLFVYSYNFENEARNFEEFMKGVWENDSIPSGKTFFNFTSNAIEFGNKGVIYKIYTDPSAPGTVTITEVLRGTSTTKGGAFSKTYKKGPDFLKAFQNSDSVANRALNNLNTMLKQKGLNFSARRMDQKVKIPQLNPKTQRYEISDQFGFDGKYSDFVAQNTLTQFMSVDVGTEENPRHVVTIQPVIRFDTAETSEMPVQFEVVQDDDSTSGSDIEAKKADIERRRQDKLNAYKLKKDGTPKHQNELTKVYAIEDIKIINAKYDAELAALETKPSDISDEVYNNFIDTGIVPSEIVDGIVQKIIDNSPFSQREQAIYADKVGEINEQLLKKRSDISNKNKPSKNSPFGSPSKIGKMDQTTGVVEVRSESDTLSVNPSAPDQVNEILSNFNPVDRMTFEDNTGIPMEDYIREALKTQSPEDVNGLILKTLCG